ncbi:MAG: S1 RNA-binding domain-containing protein [Pirellulales bacterium]
MSDLSESAAPAPDSSGDPATNEASASPASPDSQAAGEGAVRQASDDVRPGAAPIRIGSQKSGVRPPPAVARPILPAPPPELLAKAHAVSFRPSEPVEDETTAQSPPQAREISPPSASEPGRRDVADRRDEKIHKRGQKKPRALTPIAEPPAPRKYPPPNLRSQLPEDLQLEYMEALGDQSLEEIIAGESENAVVELAPESRHKATVIAVHRDNVFVELTGRQQGVVPMRTFATPPEVGAVLDLMVTRFEPAEGLYELGLPGAAVDVGDWSEVAEGMVVEARVTGHNKGGLECEVSRLRGFIPASQISLYRVEDLAQFVDQKLPCVVTEANAEKRNLVLSHRAVLERDKAEAKEKLLAELQVGQNREGTVRSLQAFGAFVDLGGIDGLIHISQLSWDRIKHAEEVLQLGQKVKIKILKIDPETGKIGLGFRDLSENPWANAARDYPLRTPVRGTVSRIMDFGAFVRLGPGVEGLVHISELSHRRVFRVTDVLAEGHEVEVMVLSVDVDQQRIGLSLKALEARPVPVDKDKRAEPPEPETPPPSQVKRKTPLKGGVGGPPTGETFGLKW